MKIKSMMIENESGAVLELLGVEVETLAVFDAILNGRITGRVKASNVIGRAPASGEPDIVLPEPNRPSKPRIPKPGQKRIGAILVTLQYMALKADQACGREELIKHQLRQGWNDHSSQQSLYYGVAAGYMRETSKGNYLLTKKGRERALDSRLNVKGALRPVTHVHAGEGVIQQDKE